MSEEIVVFGGQGTMTVDLSTGEIVEFRNESHRVSEDSYDGIRISRFDLEEYRAYWGEEGGRFDTDILCIGYWYLDEQGVERYEPAVEEFRRMAREREGD